MSALYLIPVTLGDVEHRRVLPEYNRDVIISIRHFIVENVRTARRFLKKTEPSILKRLPAIWPLWPKASRSA